MDKGTEKAIIQRLSNLEKEVHKLHSSSGQQDRSSIEPQSTSQNKSYTASGKVPSLTHIDPSPPSATKADEPWYRTFQGWKTCLEIIAILAGVWHAWITYQQWHDLRHNVEVDQRPWVGIKDLELVGTVAVGQSMVLKIDYLNTGKTPALHVAFTNCGTGDTEEATLHMGCPDSVYGLAAPNLGMHVDFVSAPVTQIYVDRLKARTVQSYYRGTLVYRDIFGNAHHTRFCAFYDGIRFRECPHGNDMA
jgi:hypothetical protein